MVDDARRQGGEAHRTMRNDAPLGRESKRVFDSYRQFLSLKKEVKDWNGSKIVPCWPIDVMWEEHCQMEEYENDMKDLTGHVIECRTYLRGAAMPDAPITEVAASMLAKEKERARLATGTVDEGCAQKEIQIPSR